MDRQDEGFLGRWSRLKQQGGEDLEQTIAESDESPIAEAGDPATGSELQEDAEVKVLTDEDMPDIETLNEDSDYTGFLSEGVSEALKRKAMRKLFHLPEFNIRDGLNDYDDDFSVFTPLGDTVTYQMKQWMEREAEQAKQKLLEESEQSSESDPDQETDKAEYSVAEIEDVEDDLEDDFDDEEDAELG